MKFDVQRVAKDVLQVLLGEDARSVIAYLDARHTVTATRRTYKRARRKPGVVDIVVTIGKPNYRSRQKIAKANKARQRFPFFEARFASGDNIVWGT